MCLHTAMILKHNLSLAASQAGLVDEFEQAQQLTNNDDHRYHEYTAAHQKRYKDDLSSLKTKLSYLGNC